MNRPLFRSLLLLSLLLLIASASKSVDAQIEDDRAIGLTDPVPGAPVQGLVQISGFIDVEEWERYDLEFAFTQQNVWFPISIRQSALEGNILGEWDTSSITDGDYDLRFTVFLADGTSLEILVEGVRVRNYSMIETSTPAPTSVDIQQTYTPTPENTQTPASEATNTPISSIPNPAEFSSPRRHSALWLKTADFSSPFSSFVLCVLSHIL